MLPLSSSRATSGSNISSRDTQPNKQQKSSLRRALFACKNIVITSPAGAGPAIAFCNLPCKGQGPAIAFYNLPCKGGGTACGGGVWD